MNAPAKSAPLIRPDLPARDLALLELVVDRSGCDVELIGGVPVTTKVGRHLRHGTAVMADLERRPPTCPISDPSTFSRSLSHCSRVHLRSGNVLSRASVAGMWSHHGRRLPRPD